MDHMRPVFCVNYQAVFYVRYNRTDINAVFSIETRGSMSTSCSDAMSSNSCGVTEVLRDCGRAIRGDGLSRD